MCQTPGHNFPCRDCIRQTCDFFQRKPSGGMLAASGPERSTSGRETFSRRVSIRFASCAVGRLCGFFSMQAFHKSLTPCGQSSGTLCHGTRSLNSLLKFATTGGHKGAAGCQHVSDTYTQKARPVLTVGILFEAKSHVNLGNDSETT